MCLKKRFLAPKKQVAKVAETKSIDKNITESVSTVDVSEIKQEETCSASDSST